jgi:DNA-binding MarR family transcriptional regulator
MPTNSSGLAEMDPQMSAHEEEILRSLRRIMRAVDLYSRKLVTETGLSGPQLVCLRELARFGPMQSSHLAQSVNLSPATVTGILDRLESRALIARERQLADKRRVLVSLTEPGREALSEAPPALQDSFLFKLRALPVRQQAAIDTTLKQIVSMMAAEDLDAAPMLIAGAKVTSGPGQAP